MLCCPRAATTLIYCMINAFPSLSPFVSVFLSLSYFLSHSSHLHPALSVCIDWPRVLWCVGVMWGLMQAKRSTAWLNHLSFICHIVVGCMLSFKRKVWLQQQYFFGIFVPWAIKNIALTKLISEIAECSRMNENKSRGAGNINIHFLLSYWEVLYKFYMIRI